MKTLVFIIVCLLVLASDDNKATAQSYLEAELYQSRTGVSPKIAGYQAKDLGQPDGFGTFTFFWVEQYWAQAYGGLTYAPVSWLQVGLGAGLEQADNPWRIASSIWLGNDRLSALTVLETGGSGFFYRSQFNVMVTSWLGLGGLAERYTGFGPRAEIGPKQLPLQLWLTILSGSDNKTILGLVYNL